MKWTDWLTHHATLFGLGKDDHLAMLRSWVRVFQGAGFTPEELYQASLSLAGAETPMFPNEHRALLISRIRQARRARRAKTPETVGCLACRHSGYVEVPHPDWHMGRSGGRWYDFSVYCRCESGEALLREYVARMEMDHEEDADKTTRRHVLAARQRHIAAYEQWNPNWQAELAQYHAQQEAEREADRTDERVKNLFGHVIARLRGAFRKVDEGADRGKQAQQVQRQADGGERPLVRLAQGGADVSDAVLHGSGRQDPEPPLPGQL